MLTSMQRVSVWLDSVSLARGVFAHGLEWAGQLHLPLRVVAAPRRWWAAANPAAEPMESTMEAWGVACARAQVAWEAAAWDGALQAEASRPADFWVFGTSLPDFAKAELVRQSERSATPLLVCPPSWQPVARFLILHEAAAPPSAFLPTALNLCKRWRMTPVVLTVARSEQAARLGQQAAEDAAARVQWGADFDSLVGADLAGAAAQVAQWRRRTHVIVERRSPSGWRRWLGDSVVEWLGLADNLTFLALPPWSAVAGETAVRQAAMR